ncbi:YbaN family protein [Intestinibacter sp.]|uniref:YbaN family protein n=1 Tax=Intestinibacter sp. TaxID=1965304 RepID=UPI002A757198|nr:YbaN family protein [Intestinibacter sp.]MDY2735996.1 YbaN family protein [Intestinibacter sp.]MDY4575545.1 YbaN family protein [Intestinibacter sp.]
MLKKVVLIVVGTISLLLGIIGVFLPVLPTTPLLLLTSYCYIKSSDRLSEKFMKTKIYDKYVRNFHEKGGMTLKGKLMLTIPVSLMLLIMFIKIDSSIMRMVIVIMWVAKVVFFTKMKTIKEVGNV